MKKLLALLPLMTLATGVQADTAYGSLGNFDTVNDTGGICYGFEIEVDDARSTDIGYTYNYNHYGTPKISEDTNRNPGHYTTLITYKAVNPAGTTTGFTNFAPSGTISPTGGHQCTNPSVNLGCEHFGASIYSTTYTAVKYRWLDDKGNDCNGANSIVHVSTPVYNYKPPVFAPPVLNQPPVIQVPAQVVAVIPAPVVPNMVAPIKEFGDPSWVKVITTSTHKANVLALEDLVGDEDANHVALWRNGIPFNKNTDIETEWYLLQTENGTKNPARAELSGGADKIGDGSQVVTRRYEFYAYGAGNGTSDGSIDDESGEAMCDTVAAVANPDGTYNGTGTRQVTKYLPGSGQQETVTNTFDCSSVVVVGPYVGAQMTEFNAVAALDIINSLPDTKVGEYFQDRKLPVGGNTPYTTSASSLPNGLTLDSATGVLKGVPAKVGAYNFTVNVSDKDNKSVSKALALHVTGPGDVTGATGKIDYQIDSYDLAAIKAKNSPNVVEAGDPADVNGDRKINFLDYRAASLLCTKPHCTH
jgi:hypothetical protein